MGMYPISSKGVIVYMGTSGNTKSMADAIAEGVNSRNVDVLARLALTLFFGLLFAIYGIPLQDVLALSEQKKEYLQIIVYFLLSAIIVFLVVYTVFASRLKNEK